MTIYQKVLIQGILGEIEKVKDSGALSATVIMIYVAIDTMAFLSMPEDKKINGSAEFISWVNKYLKTDEVQPYQYDGRDVWGARCAKLHSFSSESNYSAVNGCKFYGYHDGSEHLYAPKESAQLVLISIYRLYNDLCEALELFLIDASKDPNLKGLIDKRLEKVCQRYNIDNS